MLHNNCYLLSYLSSSSPASALTQHLKQRMPIMMITMVTMMQRLLVMLLPRMVLKTYWGLVLAWQRGCSPCWGRRWRSSMVCCQTRWVLDYHLFWNSLRTHFSKTLDQRIFSTKKLLCCMGCKICNIHIWLKQVFICLACPRIKPGNRQRGPLIGKQVLAKFYDSWMM